MNLSSILFSSREVLLGAEENCSSPLIIEERIRNFQVKGIWMVAWMCLLEYVVLWFKEKPLPPPHQNLMSITHAVFNQLVKMWVRSIEFLGYVWLWEKYSIFPNLFSDSLSSHLGTIVIVDLCFYWIHRMSHEVMLFWAIHQVHHSSIDLTIPISLRHSPLQYLFTWIFYLPLAIIGLPISHLMVHLQLNLLYQTWIHSEAVERLGPLEWVFNTPSHHRIHHGIQGHMLDKNFGGVFIIWDYLFGTFQRERKDEEAIYGIISQPEKWNIVYHQVFYLVKMIEKAKSMTNWTDFFHTFWKGPSWIPGASRTGRECEITYDYSLNKIRPNANTSILIDSYVCLHVVASLLLLSEMGNKMDSSLISFAAYTILILAALTNIGIIYEGRPIAIKIELFRCLAGVGVCIIFPITSGIFQLYVSSIFGFSSIIWIWINSQRISDWNDLKGNKKKI